MVVSQPTSEIDRAIGEVAHRWREAKRAVAFTGAGISTESGIPDFRSPGGVWSKYPMVYFGEFMADRGKRGLYWMRSRDMWPAIASADPNAGHRTLAEAERAGRLTALVTQNIDGLHQRAGSRAVVELHGSATRVVCLGCASSEPRERVQPRLEAGEIPPDCARCGGILKPTTVQFGEPMQVGEMQEAASLAQSCDLFLVAGSSLVVHPAAALPGVALEAGATLVVINREPTPYDDAADFVFRGPCGETLSRLWSALGSPRP